MTFVVNFRANPKMAKINPRAMVILDPKHEGEDMIVDRTFDEALRSSKEQPVLSKDDVIQWLDDHRAKDITVRFAVQNDFPTLSKVNATFGDLPMLPDYIFAGLYVTVGELKNLRVSERIYVELTGCGFRYFNNEDGSAVEEDSTRRHTMVAYINPLEAHYPNMEAQVNTEYPSMLQDKYKVTYMGAPGCEDLDDTVLFIPIAGYVNADINDDLVAFIIPHSAAFTVFYES